MCTVSFIGDYGAGTIPPRNPWVYPYIGPNTMPWPPNVPDSASPSQQEFDALKREMEELKKLLLAGKEYDIAVGEPDCEDAEKVALIRKLAEIVGVNLEGVFDD